MIIDDCWDRHKFYTSKASDILRQISFACIAIIWIFKRGGSEEAYYLDDQLKTAGLFVFIGLAFDSMQYIAGSLIWHIYTARKERVFKRQAKGSPEEINKQMREHEVATPSSLNFLTYLFFYLKIPCYLTGYWFIASFLYKVIKI